VTEKLEAAIRSKNAFLTTGAAKPETTGSAEKV